MKTSWKNKTNKEKRSFVMAIIFWCLAGAIVAAIIAVSFMENIDIWFGDGLNFFDFLKTKLPTFMMSAVIIIVTIAISLVVRMILKKAVSRSNRGKTIAGMLDSFLKYITAIVLVLLLLNAWGVNTAALLAGVGVLGLVFGLGAQSLISDIISGVFIVFEGDYQVGDIVAIDDYRGTVVAIGIRTTKIVDAGGNMKVINNSSITTVINMTNELSVAICDVGVEYGDSLERIEVVIKNNLEGIKERIPSIMEGPYYKGVESLADSSVILRFVAKCKEEEKFQTMRDLNREIKIVFDKNNVNIAYPQIVLNQPIDFKGATGKMKAEAAEFVAEQREVSKNMEEKN